MTNKRIVFLRLVLVGIILLLSSILLNKQCLIVASKNSISKILLNMKSQQSKYLKETDSIYAVLKSRIINDIKSSIKRSKPNSTENKLLQKKMKTWSVEQKNKSQNIFKKALNEYILQTHFDEDASAYLIVYYDFENDDSSKILKKYEIRVQQLSTNKWIAEFWLDGLNKYSEQEALTNTTDPQRKKMIQQRYAASREPILKGTLQRYTKMLTLLYTKNSNENIEFNDPFQPLIDYYHSISE